MKNLVSQYGKAGWRSIGLLLVIVISFVLINNKNQSEPIGAKISETINGGIAEEVSAESEAETLQDSFVRIADAVGPAVVAISTEQIERVRTYYQGHPFFGPGGDPFEDFFQRFYGGAPQQEFRRFGLGSGVIIDKRGFILTNEHVVADADKITVTLSDGREFSGEVKGRDPRSDLAVIKIDADNLTVARLGDSREVHSGQWAVALGNPFGLMGAVTTKALGSEPTLTVGVVSALNRRLPGAINQDRDYSELIQTDAAINPGNSGGPLLNIQGEIIGINVAILSSSRGYEGIGFAIPINKAKYVLDRLIAGERIVYGWLGVQIQDITEDVAEYYKLKSIEGVLVFQVLPDSPAKKGGLEDGDIITHYNGEQIRHTREIIDRVSHTHAGDKIRIDIKRGGKKKSLKIKIGERPTSLTVSAGKKAEIETWRGLRVASISPEIAERFGMDPEINGVIVTEVEQGSSADAAGVRAGDIINDMDRVPIENLSDYQKAVEKIENKNALIRTSRGYVVIKANQ